MSIISFLNGFFTSKIYETSVRTNFVNHGQCAKPYRLSLLFIFCLLYLAGKKKRKGVALWSDEEMSAILEHFSGHIQELKVPGKEQCMAAKERFPEALKKRDWKNIKFCVYNKIQAHQKSGRKYKFTHFGVSYCYSTFFSFQQFDCPSHRLNFKFFITLNLIKI